MPVVDGYGGHPPAWGGHHPLGHLLNGFSGWFWVHRATCAGVQASTSWAFTGMCMRGSGRGRMPSGPLGLPCSRGGPAIEPSWQQYGPASSRPRPRPPWSLPRSFLPPTGTGEKQKEIDKRLLRDKIGLLKREIESIRTHRRQYRDKRSRTPIPVVAIVGYTNAGARASSRSGGGRGRGLSRDGGHGRCVGDGMGEEEHVCIVCQPAASRMQLQPGRGGRGRGRAPRVREAGGPKGSAGARVQRRARLVWGRGRKEASDFAKRLKRISGRARQVYPPWTLSACLCARCTIFTLPPRPLLASPAPHVPATHQRAGKSTLLNTLTQAQVRQGGGAGLRGRGGEGAGQCRQMHACSGCVQHGLCEPNILHRGPYAHQQGGGCKRQVRVTHMVVHRPPSASRFSRVFTCV